MPHVIYENLGVLATAGFLMEAFLAVGLWIPKLRKYAFTVGLLFHLGISLTIGWPNYGLFSFSLVIVSTYLLFLDAEPGSLIATVDATQRRLVQSVSLLKRLDWLNVLRVEPGAPGTGLVVRSGQRSDKGYDGIRRILEKLPVSFLWASLLGIPRLFWRPRPPALQRSGASRSADRSRARRLQLDRRVGHPPGLSTAVLSLDRA